MARFRNSIKIRMRKLKKTVKGKKPASNLSKQNTVGMTGRQAAEPSPVKKAPAKKAPKRASKPAAKKPIQKKMPENKPVAKKPIAKKLFKKKQLPKKPVNTANQPNPAVNNSAVLDKKPSKPIDKRTQKAVAHAMRNKQTAVKRHRYHGGNYILYYILVGLIIITVLVILANTVLFRCKTISVSGNALYSSEQVVTYSGLELGKNLLHINSSNAAQTIVSTLAYVDKATVKKKFPTGIEISVVESERWFGVRQGSITAAVSRGGKIVEHGSFEGLPLVIGMEPESVEVGTWLRSTVEGKNDIPGTIFSAVESASLENVCEADITDRFSIKMKLDNGRITLELGTVSDMESKLKLAKRFIDNEVGPADSVTIIIRNPTVVTMRNNTSSSDNPEKPEDPDIPEGSDDPESSGNSGEPENSQP